MLRIRLNRVGRRNLASFAIVVSENVSPKIQAQIGYYNPSFKDDDPYRMSLNKEEYEKYIKNGAQPSQRVQLIAAKLGYIESPKIRLTPKKSAPKKKAQERLKQNS